MLTLTVLLIAVIAALALGFLLGRLWEIRQHMRRHIPAYSMPPAPTSEDQAHGPVTPQDLLNDVLLVNQALSVRPGTY
jgi:hypothetical protein